MIAVRRAAPPDAAEAARVMRASIRRLCIADHGGDPSRILDWCANKTATEVRRWLAAPGTQVYVAETGGRIAAVGALSVAGEVLLNYVAPAFRFQGASSALLARMEADLAALGHGEGRLDSTATAHDFYLARGWRDVGGSRLRRSVAGQPMRKSLAAKPRP